MTTDIAMNIHREKLYKQNKYGLVTTITATHYIYYIEKRIHERRGKEDHTKSSVPTS